MNERDSRRIVRQWNSEIDDDLRRREAARREADGPWKAISWVALWVLWLALLAVLVTHSRTLR